MKETWIGRSRETPPEWQTQLNQLSGGPNRVMPWLKLVWMAGEPWEPVNRWVIYEMIPFDRRWATPSLRKQAEDTFAFYQNSPPPHTMRYWAERGSGVATPKERFVKSDSPITQQEWELFRETGCEPRLVWIIQGSFGGHKRRLTPKEKGLLKLNKRPTELPAPGDLCYAPFDNRVLHKLAEMDRLKHFKSDWEKRTRGHFIKEKRAAEKAFAAQLLKWLDSQVAFQLEATKHMWNPSDFPTNDAIPSEREMEHAEETFAEAVTTAAEE